MKFATKEEAQKQTDINNKKAISDFMEMFCPVIKASCVADKGVCWVNGVVSSNFDKTEHKDGSAWCCHPHVSGYLQTGE